MRITGDLDIMTPIHIASMSVNKKAISVRN